MSDLTEQDDMRTNAYFDNELGPAERAAFEQRLADEPALQAALARLQALHTAVGSGVVKTVASAAFQDRIARIGAEPVRGANMAGARLFNWRGMAAAAVVACALGSAATYQLATRPPAWVASASLVAVHQRALLAAQPFEVASSDRHTVRPWFDAQLALSPPVYDLAADGYPLAGGRTDVVAGKRVPVMLYRRRAHLVSVIAVPQAGSRDMGAAAATTTRDGYTVLTWAGPDFAFTAISDVADGDLASFVERLRRAMKPG